MRRHDPSLGAHTSPDLLGVDEVGSAGEYRRLVLRTARGSVQARLYESRGAEGAALFVGGVGGGFDSPARDLYSRLGRELLADGVSTLRVRFRNPTDLEEAAHDVLAGLRLLAERGVARAGLVGHSFGGAVVVTAAAEAADDAATPEVPLVVTLATQSYGTARVPELAGARLVAAHGSDDRVLPAAASADVYRRAREPKEIHLLDGAGHVLDEAAEAVHALVGARLRDALGAHPE